MAACHIENQSLKSIFRHLIFYYFFSCTIKSNQNSRPQKSQVTHCRHVSCCQSPELPVPGGLCLNLSPALPRENERNNGAAASPWGLQGISVLPEHLLVYTPPLWWPAECLHHVKIDHSRKPGCPSLEKCLGWQADTLMSHWGCV